MDARTREQIDTVHAAHVLREKVAAQREEDLSGRFAEIHDRFARMHNAITQLGRVTVALGVGVVGYVVLHAFGVLR